MKDCSFNSPDFTSSFNVFESFVDQISGQLKLPVTLEDAHHHVLAYSNHQEVTDTVRIDTIMGRQVPEKVINHLWEQGVIPTLLASDNPLGVNKIQEIGLENRIAVSIRNKKEVLGYIWVIGDYSSLDDSQINILLKAAKNIRVPMIQYYSCRNQQQGSHQDFFWQLLLGNIKSDNEIRIKLQYMNVPCLKEFTVITFRFFEDIGPDLRKQISYVLDITQQVQVIFYIFNRRDLIILVSTPSLDKPNVAFDKFISRITEILKDRIGVKLIGGAYGGIYSKYSRIETSYNEALAVLDMKERLPKETKAISSYNDLGAFRYIGSLLEERKKEICENLILKKLKEYDRCYNQQLMETLETYLDNDCNTHETANTLHIHTNTLNYRVKRIKEIGNINLNSFNQKVSIYIDLKIDKILSNQILE